jgi:hypothetical protein
VCVHLSTICSQYKDRPRPLFYSFVKMMIADPFFWERAQKINQFLLLQVGLLQEVLPDICVSICADGDYDMLVRYLIWTSAVIL